MQQTAERSGELPGGVFFAFPGVRVYPGTRLAAQLREREMALPRDLLQPFHFVEHGLSVERISDLLRQWRARDPRWAPLATPTSFAAMAQGLRKRGIEGPLWEYLPWLGHAAATA